MHEILKKLLRSKNGKEIKKDLTKILQSKCEGQNKFDDKNRSDQLSQNPVGDMAVIGRVYNRE